MRIANLGTIYLMISVLIVAFSCAPQNVPAQEYTFEENAAREIIGTVEVTNGMTSPQDSNIVQGYYWINVETPEGPVIFRYKATPNFSRQPQDTVEVYDKPSTVIVTPELAVIPETSTATFTIQLWIGG